MNIIEQIKSFKKDKYEIVKIDITGNLFDKQGVLINKKRRILNHAVLVLATLSTINLNEEKNIDNILAELEKIKKESLDVSFLNVIVFNLSDQETRNLFFANDSLRMEVSLANIDEKNKRIIFHKQNYAFSSSTRKIIVEEFASLINFQVQYVHSK